MRTGQCELFLRDASMMANCIVALLYMAVSRMIPLLARCRARVSISGHKSVWFLLWRSSHDFAKIDRFGYFLGGLRQNGTLPLLIFKALLFHMTLGKPSSFLTHARTIVYRTTSQ